MAGAAGQGRLTLARIRVALVGRARAQAGYALEDDAVLLGLEAHDPSRWNDVVGTLVETHALRNDGSGGEVVLLVPRYVGEHVTGLPGARRNGLHPSTSSEGEDAATLETAAELWDPTGGTVLTSLRGALEAARMVTGRVERGQL